jgi:hypothetical protein
MLACPVHVISAIATFPSVTLAATFTNMDHNLGLFLLPRLDDFQDLL